MPARKKYAKAKPKAKARPKARVPRARAAPRARNTPGFLANYGKAIATAMGGVGGLALSSALSRYLGGNVADQLVQGSGMLAESIGGWAGRLISGNGAYKINKNSMLGGDQAPFMHSSKDGVRVRHREFLGDLSSSTTFVNTSFSMNPGVSSSFPWLSALAQNFEEYRFEGLVFEFKSTSADALNSTNTALGTVVLAAEYNTTSPAYINKQQMENAMWCVSVKPSCSTLMPVECAPQLNPLANLYIRTAAVPSGQDQRLYDLCNVQVATVGSQAVATVGELWVSYDCVLLKPQLSSGLNLEGVTAHYKLNSVTSTGPFGSTQTVGFDSLGVTFNNGANSGNVVIAPGNQGKYLLNYTVNGGSVGLVNPALSYSNITNVVIWNNDASAGANNASSTGGNYIQTATFQITNPELSSLITFSTGGTLPTSSTSSDLFITQLNGNIAA